MNVPEMEPIEDKCAEVLEEKAYTKDQKEKYIALFKARRVLQMIGTMPERMSASKHLKRMKKLGIKSL